MHNPFGRALLMLDEVIKDVSKATGGGNAILHVALLGIRETLEQARGEAQEKPRVEKCLYCGAPAGGVHDATVCRLCYNTGLRSEEGEHTAIVDRYEFTQLLRHAGRGIHALAMERYWEATRGKP